MQDITLFNFAPVLHLLVVGAVLASGPLLWVYLRNRRAGAVDRIQALTLVTLFLTFDLVLFGSFTRLSDSGLGCPDWPGCYGSATPIGAHAEISAAQAAMPTGPVTHGKAWVEMVHRYLATGVGALITVLTVAAWWAYGNARNQKTAVPKSSRMAISPWWPTLTFLWVCMQGAFGAFTVTMKLFPAIVSLHLLGGYGLLALLAAQAALHGQRGRIPPKVHVSRGVRVWMLFALLLLLAQASSGAWVSTNYAVLACPDFPQCHGSWWPSMDFARALEIWRPLNVQQDGSPISAQTLATIHYMHRLCAVLTIAVLASLAWAVYQHRSLGVLAAWLGGLIALQLATGISNVVLGWPMLAAVLHTGGAGALTVVLIWLLFATHSKRLVQ